MDVYCIIVNDKLTSIFNDFEVARKSIKLSYSQCTQDKANGEHYILPDLSSHVVRIEKVHVKDRVAHL